MKPTFTEGRNKYLRQSMDFRNNSLSKSIECMAQPQRDLSYYNIDCKVLDYSNAKYRNNSLMTRNDMTPSKIVG